ncbi:MAG: NUDIX hydrolase [archaeon GW2011_AR3]|nr:MAG: NUDIX hydrolase [archaeon GW2011_AR3]MBS3109481.1 NUDIX domain-containing protein [Candidatus Woesearchaeota archaeon]
MAKKDAKEEVAVVDRNDRLIGKADRESVIRNRKYFRAVRIFIKNKSGEFTLLKRTESKIVFPGCWELGAGGAVKPGETYLAAAKREIKEELGITDPNLKLIRKVRIEIPEENLFVKVYSLTYDGKYKLQKSEVTDFMTLPREKIAGFGRKNKIHYPTFNYFAKFSKERLL